MTSMYFPDSWVDDLRSRVDIADVIGSYVQLRQKGSSSTRLWACCPFHHEKTPSFSVDLVKQMYYCFGCHKGGSVFTFVMEMDHMEYPEVLRELAERVNLPLPAEDGIRRNTISADEKQLIRDANKEAAHFYHRAIWTPDGAEALAYLHKRGLTDRQIKHFGLGSTLKESNSCLRYLKEKGFSEDIITKSGLAVSRDGRAHDMFFNRVMFPIIDSHGHVLGFGGRVMGKGEPKYLNTGDTPVFNKRRNLYAINYVRNEHGLKKIILSEGYMDVIALRCAGIQGVVATLGTALTEEQAKLMKRLAPEIWISYDGDGAGQKAALRALDIFEQIDVKAKVLDYPQSKDPDEFIREYGVEAFENLKPLTAAEYRMLRAKDGFDLSDEEQRTEYAKRCCAILKREDPLDIENYLKKLTVDTGFSKEVLKEQIGIVTTERPQASTFIKRMPKEEANELKRNESMLLTLLAQNSIPKSIILEQDFTEGLPRKIAKLLLTEKESASVFDRLLQEGIDAKDIAYYMNSELVPTDQENALHFANDCLAKMRKIRQNALRAELIQEYNSTTDPQRREEIARQLV